MNVHFTLPTFTFATTLTALRATTLSALAALLTSALSALLRRAGLGLRLRHFLATHWRRTHLVLGEVRAFLFARPRGGLDLAPSPWVGHRTSPLRMRTASNDLAHDFEHSLNFAVLDDDALGSEHRFHVVGRGGHELGQFRRKIGVLGEGFNLE